MDRKGLLVMERIEEVSRICAREHPIYEQISSFSIALYVLGFFCSPDLMSFDDVESTDAAEILKAHFVPVDWEALPPDYYIGDAQDQFLLVFGDPAFPVHFAVVADMRSQRPYFSKLIFFGSGFDSLAELKNEFMGKDGVGADEPALYKRKRSDRMDLSPHGKARFRPDGCHSA